jgi:adenine-specific DNA-methyltransferase
MLEDTTIEPQDMSEGKIITRLLDPVTIYDSYNVNSFRLEGEWRYSQEKLDQIITEGDELIISKIPFRPNHIKKGGDPKKLKNLLSSSHYNMATYEDATAESRAMFGHDNSFPYPKPEMLIQLLINSVTKEGDIVLDSFAGSGTTGAVAHKMGRRWIMVELGEHCHTHIIPRMKKVIDGTDQGGISKDVNWKGGGGFRYYRLAPSLLEKDKWGNWVISKDYNKELLAEAICKLEGFIYAPSETIFWQQGYSTDSDYIYVTTQILNEEQIRLISEEVGDNRTLLILCLAFTADVSKFNNLTVKKIPKQILNKCEYGKDDYSLNIKNLPLMEQPEKQSSIFEEGEI